MAFQYPDKPWNDGQTVRQDMGDGTVLIGHYDASKNLWQFSRSTEGATSGIVTTADVYTLNERPDTGTNPFQLDDDPSRVVNQQEANWWLFEDLDKRARKIIVSNTEPTEHPLYTTSDKKLIEGDMWLDTKTDVLYWYDGSNWQEFSGGRPPIFSDVEPVVHPDFLPPNDVLIKGDIWYDTTDPDKLDQYVYDGVKWVYFSNFVRRLGGDSMEGPLDINGGRTPNADGVVSTIKALNVDSGQDSDLQLRHNGNTKVYVGKDRTTTTQGIKFNQNNLKITGSSDAELFTMNTNGVFYEGAYTADKHIATKQTVEEEIYDDITDKDNTNFFVRRDGDSMSGHLEMTSDAGIAFNELGDNKKALNLTRKEGEYPALAHLNHVQGSTVVGGYDINVGGNTNYNELRLMGGSNATVPSFKMRGNGDLYFYKDLTLDGNQITGLATATADNHAVPYGQVKQELQEFRDNLIQDLAFGTWRYQSGSVTPVLGRFYGRSVSAATSGFNVTQAVSFTFNEDDFYGNPGAWDRIKTGNLLTLTKDDVTVKYRIGSDPTIVGSSNEGRAFDVNFISTSGPANFIDGLNWTVRVTEFKDIDVDALDDTYLRLDCDNSPLVSMSGLEIKTDAATGSGFGEAALTLNGKRDNNNNSAASIKFKNWNYDDSDDVNGYITYRTNGTLAGGFFRFNKSIDLLSHDVYNVEALKLNNPGSIWSGTDERISFKTATNGNPGSGLVQFNRPGTNGRRGFTIRGKNTSNADADILFSFTNSSGGDSIDYLGRQDANTNHLATTKYVKDYVDNNVTAGATNISISRNSTSVTVQSSTGTNGTISAASGTNAGVMTSSDKSKLDGMSYKIAYGSGNYFITSV